MLKKIFLLLYAQFVFISALCANPVKNLNLYESFSTSIKHDSSESNSWKFNSAQQLNLAGISTKIAWTSDTNCYTDDFTPHDPAWGIVLLPSDFTDVPFHFKFGKLNPCGVASKLKNPATSAVANPLHSVSNKLMNLTISLPSGTSYSKPFAGAFIFSTDIHNKFVKNISFSAYTDETEKSILNSSVILNPLKKVSFSISYTTELFFNECNSSTWYNTYSLLSDKLQTCQNFQFIVSHPSAILNVNSSIYDSGFTMSADNSIKINNFKLNLSAFIASSDFIITTDNSLLKTMKKVSINPQFTHFYGKSAKIRTGYIAQIEEKYQSDGTLLLSSAFGISTEIKTKLNCITVSLKATSINLGTTFQNLFDEGIELSNSEIFNDATYSGIINYSHNSKLKPKIQFSFSYNPEAQKSSYKATSSIYLSKKLPVSIKSIFSIKTKENDFSDITSSVDANLTLKKKKLLIKAALSLKYDFL